MGRRVPTGPTDPPTGRRFRFPRGDRAGANGIRSRGPHPEYHFSTILESASDCSVSLGRWVYVPPCRCNRRIPTWSLECQPNRRPRRRDRPL